MGPIEAVLYWVDLTGFTALTEQLQRQGRRGAEELSTWMERWFFPLEDRLHRLGGRVLLSGGDGLVAALPPSLPRDDLLALLADTHDRLSHWEGPTLQIKQALHRGRIYPVPLPDLPDRMLFTGPVLQTLARRVEHMRSPKPWISRRVWQSRRGTTGPWRALRPYTWTGDVPSLFRRITVCFLEQPGWSPRRVRRTAEHLLPLTSTLEGTLIKALPSAEGFRWLVVFGFPRMQEDAVERALTLVHELQHTGETYRFALAEGVAVNLSLGGFVDLVGDVLNTAARILSRTPWGQCWTTERLLTSLPVHAPVHELRVKGKREPLRVRAVEPGSLPTERPLPPLVGRARERDLLHTWLPEPTCCTRPVRLALSGPPGIGKTRLRQELTVYARGLGWLTVVTKALSTDPRPLAFINRWLRRWLDLPLQERPEALRPRLRTLLQAHRLPTYFLPLLTWLLGGDPPDPDTRVGRLEDQAAAVLTQLLAAFPSTLHVLEDLHWLDPLSRDILNRLLAHPDLPPHAFLLVSRPEGVPLPADHELILHPLPFPDTLALLETHRRRLAPHLRLDVRTQRRLAHQAGGIPLYVEELLRAYVEGDAEPPARLEALIASRVDHLAPEVRTTLFLIACIGERAPRPLVHALLDPNDRQAHLSLLMARGFLREGRHTYRFRHDLIREVVYAQLLYRTRRRFHRRIAETMERLGMAARQPALAAHHWREGGRPDRAWPLDLQAARAALRRGDVHRARTWFDLAAREAPTPRQARAIRMERVLTADPRVEGAPRMRATLLSLLEEVRRAPDATPEEAPRLLAALALAELNLESGALARQRLEEARACFPPHPSDTLRLAYHLNAAAVEQQMGHYTQAEHHLKQALAVATRSEHPDDAWTVRNRLADLMLRTGRGEEALQLLEEGSRWIPEDHALRRAQYFNTLGNVLKELGRVEEAEKAYRHGLREARLAMNAELQGTLLGNLGSILEGQGRMDEARTAYEDAIALFRALGNRRGEAFMLGSLGVLDKQLGRLQEARDAFEAALRIAWDLHHHMLIVRLLNSLGGIAHLEGDPVTAEALYREALKHHPIPYMRVVIHINLALLALDRHQPDEARQWIRAVRTLLRQSGATLLRGYATWVLARVLRLRGRPGCAQRLLEQARRHFEACRHPMGTAFTRVTEAHLRLDQALPVDELLAHLEEDARRLGVGPKSELGRAIEALRRRLRFRASAPHTDANAVHAGDGGEAQQPP